MMNNGGISFSEDPEWCWQCLPGQLQFLLDLLLIRGTGGAAGGEGGTGGVGGGNPLDLLSTPGPSPPTLLFPKQCTANTTFALGPIKRLTNHNQKNQQINKLLKLWRHNSFEKNLQHNFQNSGEGAAGVHPSLKILKNSLWIWFAILPYQVGH